MAVSWVTPQDGNPAPKSQVRFGLSTGDLTMTAGNTDAFTYSTNAGNGCDTGGVGEGGKEGRSLTFPLVPDDQGSASLQVVAPIQPIPGKVLQCLNSSIQSLVSGGIRTRINIFCSFLIRPWLIAVGFITSLYKVSSKPNTKYYYQCGDFSLPSSTVEPYTPPSGRSGTLYFRTMPEVGESKSRGSFMNSSRSCGY